mgnify:CR=1 FL=1
MAVVEVTEETVAEELVENVTEEEAETEIVSVKAAETEEVVKSVENFRDFLGGTHPIKTWLKISGIVWDLTASGFALVIKEWYTKHGMVEKTKIVLRITRHFRF